MSEVTDIAAELRLVVGQLVRRVRAQDPTPPPVIAVLGLLGRDGAMTTSELATARRVRPQSMARTVGQLVESGLASRSPHPTDARKTPVELTDAGRATLERERTRRSDWLAGAIRDSLTPAERRTLAAALPLMGELVRWQDRD